MVPNRIVCKILSFLHLYILQRFSLAFIIIYFFNVRCLDYFKSFHYRQLELFEFYIFLECFQINYICYYGMIIYTDLKVPLKVARE